MCPNPLQAFLTKRTGHSLFKRNGNTGRGLTGGT